MFNQEELQLNNEDLNCPLENVESAFLFALPNDYFSDFPGHVLSMIRLINKEDPVFEGSKTNPFPVPANYFEQLLDSLKINIFSEEKQRVAFLGSLSKQLPFSIPDTDYFKQFEQELFERLGLLPDWEVLKADAEIAVLSPLLADLKDKFAFEVPEGYFESPRKTVVFQNPAIRSIKWMRWAAAVMILFIFSVGGWQFLNAPAMDAEVANAAYINQQLSEIPEADIQEYLSVTLSDYDLNDIAKNVDFQSGDNLLQGISDQDIKAYLEDGVY